ncbi:MAG: C10 family peptidase [candidate division Zixibacteria bacterium]|nr:C10 family peptidase [candidate division Zixibacteria bacterium]
MSTKREMKHVRTLVNCGMIRGCIGVLLVAVILVAGVSNSVLAELATNVEMENVAQNWVVEMTAKRSQWAGASNPAITEGHELRQDGRLLARYYDVSPQGFVVVPVLKEMNPVVMYSDESILDASQEGGMLQLLRDMISSRLDMYESAFGTLNATQPTGGETLFDSHQKANWTRLAVDSRAFRTDQSLSVSAIEEVGPLLTSSWHQSAPYNNSCPAGDGGTCVVGCTATSLSQILDYWEWPENGVGSHSYYWGGDDCNGGYVPGQTLTADFSDSYDWANMPDSCDGVTPCTQAQEDALAELCHEAGVAVNMNYSNCGSGASMNMDVFPTYFKYSPNIAREYRINHTVQSWFEVIQDEVNAGRVMWYGIHSHAIVCDGWRDQGGGQLEMHLNYGWGQGNNAWYVLDNLYCGWVEGDICPYEVEHVTTHMEPQYVPAMVFVGKGVNETIGDGDGLIEAGETVQVDVTVKNLGNYAVNATGTLSSSDANANITVASTTFAASFGWGEESSSQSSFTVEIDPACPDPHVIVFDLQITADGGYLTTETFLLFVGETPGWSDDLEGDVSLWAHDAIRLAYVDEWHMETYRAHSGSSSWKAGGAGDTNHSDASDGGLVTQPFLLPVDAKLTFWHWMEAEDDVGMTAWDGSILMISTGDGNWTQIDPVGGYPYTIIDNDASPFAPGTPCYSGSFGWTEATFDLSEYSGVVQIMFRFGSDGAVNFEGWYVDDIWIGNTLVGSNVEVNPAPDVTLTFTEVTEPGITTVTSGPTGPGVPVGMIAVPADPVTYHDIVTDAVFSGVIDICFDYDEGDVTGDENDMTLQHYDGSQWTDIAYLLDTDANSICGLTTSLSPFLLAVESAGCCLDRVGDANGIGGDEPTIGDVSVMIDAKFITGTCEGILACMAEADVNQSGGSDPICGDITIGDISVLIDYLFITGVTLGLPSCL